MGRILDRLLARKGKKSHATVTQAAPLLLHHQDSTNDLQARVAQLEDELVEMCRELEQVHQDAVVLEAEVQRLTMLTAARVNFEGCEVRTMYGPGVVIFVGTEIEVLLATGNMYHARYVTDVERVTAPDPRLAYRLRRELRAVRGMATHRATMHSEGLEVILTLE